MRVLIAMRTDLTVLPEVTADRVQLQKVFMNLMLKKRHSSPFRFISLAAAG
jgi:hypothetical protein